jgi:prevent-host-death family protein
MKAPEEIAISKFKATCLAVLERVRRTGKTVRVTRFGKPVADIVPPRPSVPAERRLGFMEGALGEYADIVGPTGALDEAETLREWDDVNRRKKPERGRPGP